MIIKTIILSLIICASIFAKAGSTFTGSRAMGMGNANRANADDASATYLNPACLDLFQEHMQLSVNLSFFGNPALSDLASFSVNQGKKLGDLKKIDHSLYEDMRPFDLKWLGVGINPNVAFMARTFDLTWGASYYWHTPLRLMLESGVLVPKFFVGAQMDQVLTASVAKRFGRRLSLGASLKFTDRYAIPDRPLTLSELLEFTPKFSSKEEAIDALDPLLEHTTGPGLDVGAVFHFGSLKLATTLQDFPSYMGGELLRPRLSLASAYKILPLMETKLVEDATVTMDIADIMRYGNFLTKLNLGAELRIKNLDLRAGVHQGYITAGTTLNFFIFHFDYLHFTEEIGDYPGFMPASVHFIQLGADIRF
ncbi:MAG: hypothetical protein JNL74_20140 [Fibrobacteres bacterium]|nr:hypothetical protein [Fibrobacterota bacterium]